MKLHSLKTFELGDHRSPDEKFASLGPIAARHGRFPKGTVLPTTLAVACARAPVSLFPEGHIPAKYFETLEQDQKLASCCRHPENHDIEALKTHPDEPVPDVYILHCTCGRKHRRLCVGNDKRPFWIAEAV